MVVQLLAAIGVFPGSLKQFIQCVILLVEDEPDLGRAIKRTLTQEAYVVDWVQSGDAALTYLERQHCHLRVGRYLTGMLPGLTGLEICRWLRARQNALPISHADRQRLASKIASRGSMLEPTTTLVKPFSMDELLARTAGLETPPR